jgi:hypothetical protein
LEYFLSSTILTNETWDLVGSFTAVTDRNCLYIAMVHGANYTDGWIMDVCRSASVSSSSMIMFNTCIFSIDGDIHHPVLVDGLAHVDICNTHAVATNICNTTSAANVNAEYVID